MKLHHKINVLNAHLLQWQGVFASFKEEVKVISPRRKFLNQLVGPGKTYLSTNKVLGLV